MVIHTAKIVIDFLYYNLNISKICTNGQDLADERSAIDMDLGPELESFASANYKKIKEILLRLTKLCIRDGSSAKKPCKHEQRLLRNMGVHTVVLDLLQIQYEKVGLSL